MTEFEEIVDSIKNSKKRDEIFVRDITREGYIEIAKHLKDAKVSYEINLCNNKIGDAGAIEMAEHLKDAKVSQTINLDENEIGDAGAIGVAEHLKDAKVSRLRQLI
jgi:hypothetical protein